METRLEENRLKAYIGFAKKKHALYVGRKLEERLTRNRISLVVFNKTCSDKNEEKRKNRFSKQEGLSFVRYNGALELEAIAGYGKLNAIGISDIHLAKAIYDTIEEENKKGEKNVEEKQQEKPAEPR